jgi:predicted anti-sigma-YlaC factor YlaD
MAMSGQLRGCEQIRSTLPALIGDEQPDGDRTAVYAHLRACPGCRREYGAYLRAERALHRLAALPEPHPGFFAELERDTLATLPVRPSRARAVGWRLAVACFLGGIAVPIVFHWTTGPASVGPGLRALPPVTGEGAVGQPGRLERLSLRSRHRGLGGLLQTERSPWGDPPLPRPK